MTQNKISVIELAEEVGKTLYGPVGNYYRFLEMSYLLACTKQPFYVDMKHIRAKMNIFLYWERGYFKTSGMLYFLRNLTPAEDVVENPNAEFSYLRYDSITKARARGSAEGKEIILPLVSKPDIIVMGELLNSLGAGEEMSENLNFMLTAMEESVGTTSLVKMRRVRISEAQIEEMQRFGIIFSERDSILRYTVRAPFWIASRPLPKSTHDRIEQSGFFDRCVVIKHPPEALRVAWEIARNDVPEDMKDELYNYNEQALDLKEVQLYFPPEEFMNAAKRYLKRLYDNVMKTGIPFTAVASGRDNVLMAQIIASHALDRTVVNGGDFEYTIHDVKSAITDILYLVKNKVDAKYVILPDDMPKGKYFERYMIYKQELGRAEYERVREFCCDRFKISRETFWKMIERWKKSGWVTVAVDPRNGKRYIEPLI